MSVAPAQIPKTVEEAWAFYCAASGTRKDNRNAYLAFLSAASWAAAIVANEATDNGISGEFYALATTIIEFVPEGHN